MITGRDLIIYILANGLENEPVIKDGKLIGFMTVAEAAAKFDVGEATVNAWYNLGVLDGIEISEVIYISPNAKPPIRVYGEYGEFCGLSKQSLV